MPGDSLSDVVIVDVTNIGIQGPPGPIGPIGPAGPSGTTGLTPIVATGGSTAISLQDHFGYIITVRDFGATGNGMTDDTAAIQAAIAGVGAGLLFWPEGTYKISGTLTVPTMQRWQGASSGSTILQWAGGNNADMVTTTLPTYADKGGIESMTLHAGSGTGITLLHLRNTHQSIYRNIYLDGNNGAGNVCLFLEAGAGGQTANCCHNAFYHIIGRNSAKGLVITGASGNGATDNAFFFSDFSSIFGLSGYVGIELQQWCDSNLFYYTRITLQGANGICVWVGSMTPPSTPSAYDYTFSGIFLDNVGPVPNATGFKLGSMSGLYATGVFISPQPYTGLVIDADPVNARSYYISTTNGNLPGVSVMQTYQKAYGDHPEPQFISPGFVRTRGQLGGAPIGFANRLYATPIFFPLPYTVKTLSLSITAANTTSAWNVRLGIYADNGFSKPGALVAGSDGGNLTVAQGATTGETITFTTPIQLSRGLYWVAAVVDVVGASVLCSGPSGPCDAGQCSVVFPTALQGLGSGCYSPFTFGALPPNFGTTTLSPGLDTPVVILGL